MKEAKAVQKRRNYLTRLNKHHNGEKAREENLKTQREDWK